MLTGRRVLVAGIGGIGAATARQLLAHGARVHVVDLDPEKLAVFAEDVAVSSSAADLSEPAVCDRVTREALEAMGGLDGLVAITGGSGRRWGDGPVGTLSAEAVERTWALNALPQIHLLDAFVRAVEGSPRPLGAVLIGSVLASRPNPEFATHAYAFAKAGIEGLAKAAASRLAAHGIQVNVVAPGLTRTPMSARAQSDDSVVDFARTRQPLTDGGFVDPEEVASACAWLLSTREVTGQVIAVDGGWSVC
ncbi:MAG TPA: SDR family oxidoreductase [Phycicoccus sp.]|nr:SDR family oxidoreductase [Phycicoccus sp.]